MATKKTYEVMLDDLLVDLQKVTVATIVQSGVDKNSNLTKSIKYVTVKNGVNMVANYYYPYVSSGRKSGIKKVPIKALIEYIKRYNIPLRPGQTLNQLAFALQQHIFKAGIKSKNFDDKVVNAAGEITQMAVADELAVAIADELVDMFEI
jgi:hypothetical protein